MMTASGEFDVEMKPQAPEAGHEDTAIGRMLLDKIYRGDLEASSLGQMLASGSPTSGGAGYVAMERVSGTLGGRAGSFVLQHSGTMAANERRLELTIVPGSGTGEIGGISGAMRIEIEDGKHFYTLDYDLP